jgi:hypothetical protein
MYLVDTNVISAGALSKGMTTDLVRWMDINSLALYLSVVTVAEITDGIAKTRREGATRKADALSAWLETVMHLYSQRILTFDQAVAGIAGTLSDRARGQGHSPGFADIVIAATAQRHGLTILSRNLNHFEPFGVAVLDPFVTLPPN